MVTLEINHLTLGAGKHLKVIIFLQVADSDSNKSPTILSCKIIFFFVDFVCYTLEN